MPWKDLSVVEQRRALVETLLEGAEPVVSICRNFGVSRQTAYKFLQRFRSEGGAGLNNRVAASGSTPAPQAVRWRQWVLRLRRSEPTWGARKLLWLLRQQGARRCLPAERTVQRWLKQAGFVARKKQPRRQVRPTRRSRGRIARRSNQVWTIDLEGWFLTGNRTKIEPLTVRDLWSKYVLWARRLAPRDEAGVRWVCQQLFRRYGRPRVIRCDLGAPFFGDGPHGFTRLSLWWWRLGISIEFVRRGAINNNAHEQMHRVMKAELAITHTATAQAQRLESWRRRYNRRRPHEALGGRTPASVYRPRPGRPVVLRSPRYPRHYLVKHVQQDGSITLPGWRGSIGRAFGGLRIGLAPAGDRCYRVYFTHLYLGLLDLNQTKRMVLATF